MKRVVIGLALAVSGLVAAGAAGRVPAATARPPVSRTSAAVERCEASGQATAPFGTSPAERYHLVKNWDFRRGIRDEATLRAEFETRYVYDGGRLDHLGDEWSRYREHDNHVFTPNGLALVARVDGEPAPGKIESGMLRSRWTGRYGVFEICMRAPEGKGLWPAFWLNPEDGRWPPEIDVVEIVNDRGPVADRSFHFLHGKGVGAAAPGSRLDAEGAYPANPDYSRAFHLFSVEWSPSRVRHLVDGVRVADREFRWIHDDGSDAGPAHVLVNLAVGGHWAGVPSDPAIFPAALEVAFMRVWQR